jgi:branched-chain amino acid transport system ATP-binding protein
MTMTGFPLLCVQDVSLSFGGIAALSDVSFDVPASAVTGIIGPNGAGKTSLFNCLSGLYTPQAGRMALDGTDLAGYSASRRATIGLARTFQNIALFDSLSVIDNVKLGANASNAPSLFSALFASRRSRGQEREVTESAYEALEWVGIRDIADQPIGRLTFATRKQVELARAVASRPKVIMLDEPAGGLNHEAVQALGVLIRRLVDARGVSVLLIEHHMNLVMDVSQHVVVLNFGKKICEGTPRRVRRDPAVVQAYLGDA